MLPDLRNICITLATRFEPARHAQLFACLSNLLINSRNLHIEFICAVDGITMEGWRKWRESGLHDIVAQLIKVNNHVLNGTWFTPDRSLGDRKAYFLKGHTSERTHWMNVDDDFLIPTDTLDRIEQAIYNWPNLPLLYGNWDVLNTRNYPDWSDKYVTKEEVHEILPRNLVFRLIDEDIDGDFIQLKQVPYISPAFIVPFKLLTPKVFEAMGSLPVGVRGYDIEFGRLIDDWNLILGANGYHTGVQTNFLEDGKWNDVSKTIKQTDFSA